MRRFYEKLSRVEVLLLATILLMGSTCLQCFAIADVVGLRLFGVGLHWTVRILGTLLFLLAIYIIWLYVADVLRQQDARQDRGAKRAAPKIRALENLRGRKEAPDPGGNIDKLRVRDSGGLHSAPEEQAIRDLERPREALRHQEAAPEREAPREPAQRKEPEQSWTIPREAAHRKEADLDWEREMEAQWSREEEEIIF